MSRQYTLGTVATCVRTESGKTIVRYHDTDVVSFDASTITLDSGGWKTATTKRRMNQAAITFGLEYHVRQRQGRWYVKVDARSRERNPVIVPFTDGMTIERKMDNA